MTFFTFPSFEKMGLLYFNSYKYEEAINFFEKINHFKENNVSVLNKLKDYFLLQGNVERAILSQKRITELLPKNIKYLEELAKLYSWNQKPLENLKTREKVVALSPKGTKENELLEILEEYRWLRAYNDSDRIALSLQESTNPKVLIEVLKYYLSTHHNDRIISLAQKLSKINGPNVDYYTYVAQSYELSKDFPNAIKFYMAAVAKDISAIKLYSNLQFISIYFHSFEADFETFEHIVGLHRQLHHDELVSKMYMTYALLSPKRFELALANMDALIRDKKFQEIKNFVASFSIKATSQELYQSALLMVKIDFFEDAILYLEKALEINPTALKYYEELTYLYEKRGLKKKALELQYRYLKILKNKGVKTSSFIISIDETLLAMNDFNQKENSIIAKEKLEIKKTQQKIIQLHIETKDVNQQIVTLEQYCHDYPFDIEYLRILAGLYSNKQEDEKAQNIYSKINKMNPSDPEAALFLADFAIQNNNFQEAENYLYTINKGPNNWVVLNRLEAIYDNRDIKSHQKVCDEVLKTSPTKEFLAIETTAKCLYSTGQKQKAIILLNNDLKANPQHKSNRILLTYYLLDLGYVGTAISNFSLISKDLELRKEYLDLKSYFLEIVESKRYQNAWDHTANFNYFNTSIYSYLHWNLRVNKNIFPYFIGYQNQQNNYLQGKTHNGYHALVSGLKKDNGKLELWAGKNYGKSTKISGGVNAQYLVHPEHTLSASIASKQITNDLLSWSFYPDSSRDMWSSSWSAHPAILPVEWNLGIRTEYYHISNLKLNRTIGEFNLDYRKSLPWFAGIYFRKQNVTKNNVAGNQIVDTFAQFFSVGAKHEWNKSWWSEVRGSIGRDTDRNIPLGKLRSFQGLIYYNHGQNRDGYFQVLWFNESLNSNVSNGLLLGLNYQIWI